MIKLGRACKKWLKYTDIIHTTYFQFQSYANVACWSFAWLRLSYGMVKHCMRLVVVIPIKAEV